MKKKEIIDFITGIALLIIASAIILMPSFKLTNIKTALIIIFSFYTVFKLTQFIFTIKEKDYESLFTSIIAGIALIVTIYINITSKNLALILLIWMSFMSLVKLKKADFYHDRQNKIWILRLIMLFIFIASGLLTGINLFYETTVQILLVGYFFFINSVLDTIEPIVVYLTEV